MNSFILSNQARLDYFEAFDFIASYSPRAALRWEERMLDAFAHLSVWLETGRVRPEFAPPDMRFWIVDDYLVLYRCLARPVEIVAILHGAQDLPGLIATRLLE